MARSLRAQLPDGTYHATARSVDACLLFAADDERLLFLRLLAIATARTTWRCHAYCLMGTHYHLLVTSTRANLSRGLHFLNGTYAQATNRLRQRRGHLFGERFGARLIQEERHFAAACRYIVRNPVSAGLVERAVDWPWTRVHPTLRSLLTAE